VSGYRRHKGANHRSRRQAVAIAQFKAIQEAEVLEPRPVPQPPPRSVPVDSEGRKVFVDQLVVWIDQRKGSAINISQLERAFPANPRNSIQARMGELTKVLGLQVIATGRAWLVPVELGAASVPVKAEPTGALFEQIGSLNNGDALLRHTEGSIWTAQKLVN
jgi:hypothetical protein